MYNIQVVHRSCNNSGTSGRSGRSSSNGCRNGASRS